MARSINDMAILLLRRRQAAHLPTGRKLDGDVIVLFKRKLKIDRVNATGVIEYALFGGAEQPNRNQRPVARPGCPARNL